MLRILRDLLETPEPAELGPTTRRGTRSKAEINQAFDNDPNLTKLSTERQELIRSLILLWHDHLDASHTIAQEINGLDGALVHGIMHRREPDHGNAGYWFRRAGEHPSYPELARRVRKLLDETNETELPKRLVPKLGWNAREFIQACAEATNEKTERLGLLREIQRIETQVLPEYFSGERFSDSEALA